MLKILVSVLLSLLIMCFMCSVFMIGSGAAEAPDQSEEGVLSVSAPAEPVSHKPGDADGDGFVSVLDASKSQKYLARFLTENDLDLLAADADGDGFVSILDATRIQKYIAKLCSLDGSTPYTPPEQEPSVGQEIET